MIKIVVEERTPATYNVSKKEYTLDELKELFGGCEGSVVLPLIKIIESQSQQINNLMDMAYHTKPDELLFAPEGWTWKQQANLSYNRIVELENRLSNQ